MKRKRYAAALHMHPVCPACTVNGFRQFYLSMEYKYDINEYIYIDPADA